MFQAMNGQLPLGFGQDSDFSTWTVSSQAYCKSSLLASIRHGHFEHMYSISSLLITHRIILLVQWNIWFAGRFLLLTFKIVGKLAHLMLQILTTVIALAAVLGNFRHPLTRFISCVSLFLILRVHLGITSWLSLPSVILTLGVLEHYLPGLLDGKELTDVAEAKKGELKELERRNSMAHTSQQKTSFRNVSYRS